MNYIANAIIDKNKLELDKSVKRCESFSDVIPSLPTLIIGFRVAKERILNFSILKKSYPEQNLYWTFSKNERRCDYEVDIVDFYNMAMRRLYENVTYEYCNVLKTTYSEVKYVISLLRGAERNYVFVDGGTLMVYDKPYGKVIGVSLSMCDYIGVKSEKVMRIVESNPSNVLIGDDSFLTYRMKKNISRDRYYLLPLYEHFRVS